MVIQRLSAGSNDPFNVLSLRQIFFKKQPKRKASREEHRGKGKLQQKLKKLILSYGNIVLLLPDETSSPVLCSSRDVVSLETKLANFDHSVYTSDSRH